MVPRPMSTLPPPALIPEYFAGRTVFITGATGFMGKVLVERLLWTCPDVERLYILMRSKKGVLPETRLAQLKESQVFDVIRERCPHRLEKISSVAGDVTLPLLGLQEDTIHRLREVSVVFHSAATLKFDEPLPAAVRLNVRSVISIMDLCDRLPNMQVLVYVSTAYSNAELSSVGERVYRAADVAGLLALVDCLPEDALAEITPNLWGNYTQGSYGALRIQYNNVFRVLVWLPHFRSASKMFADAPVDCFYATMCKKVCIPGTQVAEQP